MLLLGRVQDHLVPRQTHLGIGGDVVDRRNIIDPIEVQSDSSVKSIA
jgi:hypothetical protein